MSDQLDLAAPAPGPGTTEEAVDAAWRLTVSLMLDLANLRPAEGDFVDALVLTAILQANQAALRQPEVRARYGTGEASLPDELRRPISIKAVAESLGMPFETVRRRIRGLTEAGLCRIVDDGVMTLREAVTSPAYLARQRARVARLAQFVRDLEAAGVAKTRAGAARLTEQVRPADRLLADFMLRGSERLLRLVNNPLDGAILLALWSGALGIGPRRTEAGLSAQSIGRRVQAPSETIRRRLRALQALGLAELIARRWRPAWPPALAETALAIRRQNLGDVRRLLAGLEALQRGEQPW
jgi:predicted transcriptional regulator